MRITRRWRWLSWTVAAITVTTRFERWGCRVFGHDLAVPKIPMCWRCGRGWDTWEQAVADRRLR